MIHRVATLISAVLGIAVAGCAHPIGSDAVNPVPSATAVSTSASVPVCPTSAAQTSSEGWMGSWGADTVKPSPRTKALRAALPAGVSVVAGELTFNDGIETADPGQSGAPTSTAAVPQSSSSSPTGSAPLMAFGHIKSAAGKATLFVYLGKGASGTRMCIDADADSRIVQPDGTVVEISSGGWQGSQGDLTTGLTPAPTASAADQILAVAYRTDGTVVSANLLPAGSSPLPMTKEQLASLVSAPGLDTGAH